MSRVAAEAFSPRRFLQVIRRKEGGLLHFPLCGSGEILHRNPVALPAAERVSHRLTNDVQNGTSAEEILRREHIEVRSEEHTSELQSQSNLVCRLLLEKKKK